MNGVIKRLLCMLFSVFVGVVCKIFNLLTNKMTDKIITKGDPLEIQNKTKGRN